MAYVTPDTKEVENEKVTTVIAEDLEITGTVKFESSLLTKGIIQGEIISQGLLVVGPTAKVSASITTKTLISYGEIEGDVTAGEKAVLKKNAVHNGNINTPSIVVEGGSTFNGACIMAKRPRNPVASSVQETPADPVANAAPIVEPVPQPPQETAQPRETTDPVQAFAEPAIAEETVPAYTSAESVEESPKGEEADLAATGEAPQEQQEELQGEEEGEPEEMSPEAEPQEEAEPKEAREGEGKKAPEEKNEGIWIFNDGEFSRKPKLF